MRIDLNVRQLEAFVRVAECGSFRQAAQQLGQSQPALSGAIRRAEQTLSARLFDRDTRHVRITAVGQELLPIARRILRDFDDALGDLGEFMAGRSGCVTVTALPSISVALAVRAAAAFMRTHPQVRFALTEAPADMLLAAVEEGRADFGLSVRPAPQQRLHYQHLLDDAFVLVCRRDDPLAARRSVPWSVFATRPCIVSAPHSSIRAVTDAAFLRLRRPVRPVLEFPSVAACGAMVAGGLGITALPRLALQLVDMAALATVPLVQPAVSRPIGIVTRIGRSLSPASRAFMAGLQAEAHSPGRGNSAPSAA
ncbi:LysR family transcriptional regulator [Xenophilus azovorans]|uniref:LysR family transcriptional regulator n=1 Tax=Xenophilus azovorans TaxID=151755 RepID=UPI0006919240|nr:LysR family transcriptional regulator [Xenophilus azovorans]